MNAVVLGHVVLDEVHTPDGRIQPPALGGAGAYAALGAALVVDRTILVSGVGDDFPGGSTEALEAAGITTEGLVALDPFTPRTEIRYAADGERVEQPVHGLEHFTRLDPRIDMIPADVDAVGGLYVFDQLNPQLWTSLAELRHRTGATVLWEIHADICEPGYLPRIAEQLRDVDVLSINRTEARRLCQTDDPAACVAMLLDTGARVVALRLGSDGAVVATPERVLTALPPSGDAVDPTGAGNAFSGAFVASLATTDLEQALRDAMAAAALTIRTPGPPVVDDHARAEHRYLARALDITHLTPNRTESR